MVQVYLHAGIGHIEHLSIKPVAILILQRHYGILENMLVVEMTVYREDTAFQIQNALLLHIAIRLFLSQYEIESAALFQRHDMVFKSIQGDTETTDKLEWLFGCRLFNHYSLSVLICHQLISHGNVHIVFILHN